MTGVALSAHPELQHLHRLEVINAAAAVVRARFARVPDVAIVLGTGLGGLAREIEVEATVEYADIPGFPLSTVESHAGRLLCGTLGGKSVIAMQFFLWRRFPNRKTPEMLSRSADLEICDTADLEVCATSHSRLS